MNRRVNAAHLAKLDPAIPHCIAPGCERKQMYGRKLCKLHNDRARRIALKHSRRIEHEAQ